MTTPQKPQVNFKDPFVIWGAVLVGLGVAFGGLLGALIGALAGAGVNKLGSSKSYSQGQKFAMALGLTVAAAVVYLGVAAVLFGLL